MSFAVPGDAYDRFMGRWSEPLADQFVALVSARPGQRALDVGCGPGALTAVLSDRLGPDNVAAVDPSVSFVEAARARLPGVDVQLAGAESLPFADDTFDLVLAQLVVHFMKNPVAAITELARVTRPGGVVAACVWDHAGHKGPLTQFWAAVQSLDPDAPDESELPGAHEGHLVELFTAAGLADVTGTTLTVRIGFRDFADWWEPFTFKVGPAGAYVDHLDAAGRERLRERCAELLPSGPFELDAAAWTATGRA